MPTRPLLRLAGETDGLIGWTDSIASLFALDIESTYFMDSPRIARALISVSDKLGLADFAQGLSDAGVELYSTGGTRRHLEDHGLSVVDVSAYTGFPELMAGRLKTLHPKVFGGILCRRDVPDDLASLTEHGIQTFELVVVNLYPFEATVARPGVTLAEAIEQIDIGGPSLVRAAAKNHAFVTVVTDTAQYAEVLEQVTLHGQTSLELRRRLAAVAFARTAAYDRAIAKFFAGQDGPRDFPPRLTRVLQRKAVLRYGENPHQRAALYAGTEAAGASLVSARQLSGKELSYNNILDLDAALAIARDMPEAGAVVIKHNNPCGAASARELADATRGALQGDPVSAFGSVLGFNRVVDLATAEILCEPGLFIEAIVAPDYDPVALEILTTRPKWKSNVRLMKVGQLDGPTGETHFRHVSGGMLVQEADHAPNSESEWHCPTRQQPTDQQMRELRFAWALVRHVKSNAIVVTRDLAACGVGAGQMSRVDSVDIAINKAGERVRGAVLASDAFFPFEDSIEKAAVAGIAAIIQPGGSKRDGEVIEACNRHGIPMVLTGRRHFKH